MSKAIGKWWLAVVAALALGSAWAQAPVVTVWKSPTCGCCGKWIDYMQAAGFKVKTIEQLDVAPVKARLGVPEKLGSCHTATVGGYVIEGHVPVEDIRRLLKERPKGVKGLSAPGMPAGSPGMDIPGSPPYEVVSFDAEGRVRPYARH